MATAGITRQAIKILSKFIREGRNPDAAKAAKKSLNVTKFTKPQQKIIQDLTGEVKPISAKSGFPIGKTGFKNSPQTEAHRAASGAARVQNMIKKGNYPKQVGLPTSIKQLSNKINSENKLWKLMQNDKKFSNGKLSFIIPEKIGQVRIRNDISSEVVLSLLKKEIEK